MDEIWVVDWKGRDYNGNVTWFKLPEMFFSEEYAISASQRLKGYEYRVRRFVPAPDEKAEHEA